MPDLDLMQAADELWALRDVVSETDDCTAAQIWSVVNRLIAKANT